MMKGTNHYEADANPQETEKVIGSEYPVAQKPILCLQVTLSI